MEIKKSVFIEYRLYISEPGHVCVKVFNLNENSMMKRSDVQEGSAGAASTM